MKKALYKSLAVFLCVVMTALVMPVTDINELFSLNASALALSGNFGSSNVTWSFDSSTKVITVSGSGAMGNSGYDWTKYNARLVGKISDKAEKIVINEGVTSVGNNAFRNLAKCTTVQLPLSVTSVGRSAFEGSTAIRSVNITENITSIGAYAFKNTKLNSFTAPYKLTSIGEHAFSGVSNLTVTCNYGDAAYNHCRSYGVGYAIRPAALEVIPSLDGEGSKVNVTVKLVNASMLNAINVKLIIPAGLTPVSSETVVSENNGVTTAVVYGADSLSVAVMAQDAVPYADCTGNCEYTLATLSFDFDTAFETADFTVTCSAFMINGARGSLGDVGASVALHDYEERVITPSTCCEEGVGGKVCKYCGKSDEYSIAVDPDNHAGGTQIVNAAESTCTVHGYTGDTQCLGCGKIIAAGQSLELLEHTFVSEVIEPTCQVNGYTKHTCTVCGYTYNDSETVGEHTFVSEVIEPTCQANGYTKHTCTVCGYTYNDSETVGEHTFVSEVIEPSCLEGGYTVKICSVCGTVETTDRTNPLGHSFDENGVCTRCGYAQLRTIEFKDTQGVTVDEDAKLVKLSKVVTADALIANVNGSGWTVSGASGDENVPTGSVLGNGSLSYTVIILGDVDCNGKLTASDARTALRISARLVEADSNALAAGDFDANGKISASEARKILRVSARLEQF